MIIGITGTDGAGKGSVVSYLETKDFTHYSAREFIVAEIQRQGLTVDRNQMRLTGNELRVKHGNEFVIKQAYKRARQTKVKNVIIESVRVVAEAEYLKNHGGVLLAVDADQSVRYQRVQQRRSESDQVTYEQFVQQDNAESLSNNPSEQSKLAVMQMADYVIMNDGTIEELHQKVEQWLKSLPKP